MPAKIPKTIAGWDSIFSSLNIAFRAGTWSMLKAMFTKNTCKSCALGMGGQKGGMRDENNHFPAVCKKSFYAQASDMQPPISEDFFKKNSVDSLKKWTPLELEYAGRLTQPVICESGQAYYRPISWADAEARIVEQLKNTSPDRTFFYASGRSSNEAGFLLQLFARNFGTNNINNCSYYCHQASGVGLNQSLGTSTATIQLDDLDHTDLIFLIGANPPSNHPRFMTTLMNIRRRGGKIIVINPAIEPGLKKFNIPSDWKSLLFGSKIASKYIQPHIGGDIALCLGIAKALNGLAKSQTNVLDHEFINDHTEGFQDYLSFLEKLSWQEIEIESGVLKKEIESLARIYSRSKNVVFAWAMGITHHAHGVENVQAIVNLALMRGMVGKQQAGLLPLRGHSNVQGIGSVGFTPQLKKDFIDNLESYYNLSLPTQKGMDTLSCVEAASEGKFDFAWNLGGNLFGSNPDSCFAENALSKIKFSLYINTTLNQGHFLGRGQSTLILPALARDEEPEPTTQESMFNFIRLSEGGPPRYFGPKSEITIVSKIAQKVLPNSPIPWDRLSSNKEIRQALGSVVSGFKKIKSLDQTKKEFHIEGRVLHKPLFPRTNGKALFKIPGYSNSQQAKIKNKKFKLMTVRSEGQFNTVVYETKDKFRGIFHRNVVLMNPKDILENGWKENDRVSVKSKTGTLSKQILIGYPIRSGNVMMYYPEANILVPRKHDNQSKTPSFKSVDIIIEKEK